jgi:hypothetical protein
MTMAELHPTFPALAEGGLRGQEAPGSKNALIPAPLGKKLELMADPRLTSLRVTAQPCVATVRL